MRKYFSLRYNDELGPNWMNVDNLNACLRSQEHIGKDVHCIVEEWSQNNLVILQRIRILVIAALILLVTSIVLFILPRDCDADGGIIDLKPGYSIQKSYLDARRFDIKDRSGSVVGYIKKDVLDSRRYMLWGRDGKIAGYFKKSPLDSRKMLFFKAPHLRHRRAK